MSRLCPPALALLLLVGCQSNPDKQTIAQLRDVEPDLDEVRIDDSLVKALTGYQQFLVETPEHRMAPEAMRRMADLQIEKEYGVVGVEREHGLAEPAAPDPNLQQARPAKITIADVGTPRQEAVAGSTPGETDAEFEARAAAPRDLASRQADSLDLPDGTAPPGEAGPAQAIETYRKILADYPWYERNDQVLYQMARAHDELAQPEEAMRAVERLISEYPDSRYVDEVFFRRGEYYFVRRQYLDAEESYLSVVGIGESSPFYELALYKLGWSLYKQELYEEALHHYIALLDYKLSTGYDFDAGGGEDNEEEERRVADTFRVISLSFSNLGGPEVLNTYFSVRGNRSFEDRIYQNLAEFHFDKRRFNDAASVYQMFVELNPVHKVAPRFSMRISEIYAEGNFPLLVVESKREFATRYGVDAEYWQHFELTSMPEVVEYLKANLIDLASHYHALYQEEALEDDRADNYGEALRWYHEFLGSFPEDPITPSINYQLADLLLEHGDFAGSAREYERTAYEYPPHERASEAGYAAVYAYREHLDEASAGEYDVARQATVDSSLRFAETFPADERAPTVLGAAIEDLYAMRDFERAISTGRWLLADYPAAETPLRRATWMIVAHSSFDIASYPDAEAAYTQVLDLSGPEDEDQQAVVDNLAAAIYKQGERARDQEDYATAAEHFLRVK